MILICIANCLQPCNVVDYKYSLHGLPMDSDEYLHVLYEVSFKPSLFLCHCNFFLIMISVWLLRKCSNRIDIVLGLFSLVGIWASSLYSCLGFVFFNHSPPPPSKKKKNSIWLLKEIKFKLESQINYIVGERKQK